MIKINEMSSNNTKSTWTSVKRKHKKQIVIEKPIIQQTLKEFFQTNHCIFHFMGRCNNGPACSNFHMEENYIFKNLQKILLDPTRITDLKDTRLQITSFIKKNTPVGKYKMEPFLTSCWYAVRNRTCNNFRNERHFKYDFHFKDQIIPIYICYPDISRCKYRVTCGIHFDIQYTYSATSFNVTQLISSLKIEKKNDIIVDINLTNNDFPSLSLKKSSKFNTKTNKSDTFLNNAFLKIVKNPPMSLKSSSKSNTKINKSDTFLKIVNKEPVDQIIKENVTDTQPQILVNKNTSVMELSLELEVSDIEGKNQNELRKLVRTLIANNNELFKRNAELNYTNNILRLPIPKSNYSDKFVFHNVYQRSFDEANNQSDEYFY